MRIVDWNCSGGLHLGKFIKLMELDADLYVIQEFHPLTGKYDGFSCKKDAVLYADAWKAFSLNMIVDTEICSRNKRGYNIAVFAKPGVQLRPVQRHDDGFQLFLPFMVDERFLFLAYHGNPIAGAIDMYCYLKVYKSILEKTENIFICGDFNDNPRWDEKNPSQSFSELIGVFHSLGLISYYHFSSGETHGKELQGTYYAQKNRDKPYHIDYFWGKTTHFVDCSLGSYDTWCMKKPQGLSDHVPLIVDIV